MDLDRQNGKNKWSDAIKLEISQIGDYKVFENYGKTIFDKEK